MKTMRYAIAFFTLSLFLADNLNAQSEKEQKKEAARAALKGAVENRRYNFLAQTAIPTGGRSRMLTSPYSLALRGDTLDSDLPYFGRAYTADITGTTAGIRFTTTDFTYTANPGKKGGWDIVLTPKNQAGASRMYLSISSDGYATLSVQSTTRQNISFNGTVTANKRQ